MGGGGGGVASLAVILKLTFALLLSPSRRCAALPTITSLELVRSPDYSLVLNCSSQGSPPEIVVWVKDGVVVGNSDDGLFSTNQFLRDGTVAAYDSLLLASAGPEQVSGVYECVVRDSLGRISQTEIIVVEGKSCYVITSKNDP